MTATGLLQFDYFRRIWDFRHFWYSLVANDIRSRYRRSILGVGWSLLRPLGMTAVFCMIFGVMFQKDLRTYAPYVLLGMTTWQFLAEAIMLGCNSFALGSAYIRQQKVPHAIFPLRTVLSSGFHFLVALGLGIVLTTCFNGPQTLVHLLFLPLGLVIIFLLAWSLAILAGVIATYFPDTSHLLEILLQILFYLTPIMYDPRDFPQRYALTQVLAWNPFNAVLNLIRQPILDGHFPGPASLGISVAFLVITGLTATFLLRRLEKNLIFWL